MARADEAMARADLVAAALTLTKDWEFGAQGWVAVQPPPCGEVHICEANLGWGADLSGEASPTRIAFGSPTSPQGGG